MDNTINRLVNNLAEPEEQSATVAYVKHRLLNTCMGHKLLVGSYSMFHCFRYISELTPELIRPRLSYSPCTDMELQPDMAVHFWSTPCPEGQSHS
jgi:hypothetical protein